MSREYYCIGTVIFGTCPNQLSFDLKSWTFSDLILTVEIISKTYNSSEVYNLFGTVQFIHLSFVTCHFLKFVIRIWCKSDVVS